MKSLQDSRAYVDSIGMCTVVRGSFDFSESPTMEVMEAVTGYPFTPELMEIAQRIYSLERVILNREGIRRKDDAHARADSQGSGAVGSHKGEDPHERSVREPCSTSITTTAAGTGTASPRKTRSTSSVSRNF